MEQAAVEGIMSQCRCMAGMNATYRLKHQSALPDVRPLKMFRSEVRYVAGASACTMPKVFPSVSMP